MIETFQVIDSTNDSVLRFCKTAIFASQTLKISWFRNIKFLSEAPIEKSKYNDLRHSQGKKMLLALARKICPVLSLAIATVGCGKKISEARTEPARSIENQELPATYIIRLDGSESSSQTHILPRNASFQIPDRLKVRAGSTLNKVVDIIYDVDQYDSDVYDFKCSYVTSSSPNEMTLTYCENDNGNDFYDTISLFPIKEGQSIVMKFSGASSPDLVVEAIYSMKWK